VETRAFRPPYVAPAELRTPADTAPVTGGSRPETSDNDQHADMGEPRTPAGSTPDTGGLRSEHESPCSNDYTTDTSTTHVSDHDDAETDNNADNDDAPLNKDEIILAPDDKPRSTNSCLSCALANAPGTVENWSLFASVMDEVTAEAASTARNEGGSNKRGALDPNDAQGIQTLYRRNRICAIRLIVSGEGEGCNISTKDTEEYFSQIWASTDCDTSIYPSIDGRLRVPTGTFSPDEVVKQLKKFENTAPGDDGLTYKHWRRLDPASSLLTTTLNICMKQLEEGSDSFDL